MQTPKFTPGPWIAADGDSTSIFIYDDKGEDGYLGALATVEHADPDQLAGNAALIAAAPDLYAALEWAMQHVKRPLKPCPKQVSFDKARAALAKVAA